MWQPCLRPHLSSIKKDIYHFWTYFILENKKKVHIWRENLDEIADEPLALWHDGVAWRGEGKEAWRQTVCRASTWERQVVRESLSGHHSQRLRRAVLIHAGRDYTTYYRDACRECMIIYLIKGHSNAIWELSFSCFRLQQLSIRVAFKNGHRVTSLCWALCRAWRKS